MQTPERPGPLLPPPVPSHPSGWNQLSCGPSRQGSPQADSKNRARQAPTPGRRTLFSAEERQAPHRSCARLCRCWQRRAGPCVWASGHVSRLCGSDSAERDASSHLAGSSFGRGGALGSVVCGVPWQGSLHGRVPPAVEEDIRVSGYHLALVHGGDCAVIEEPPAWEEGRVKQADGPRLQERSGGAVRLVDPHPRRCAGCSCRWAGGRTPCSARQSCLHSG